KFGAPAMTAQPRSRQRTWIVAVAALNVLFAGGLTALALTNGWFQSKPAATGASRFQVPLPDDTSMPSGPAAPQMAISPDGRNLVFAVAGSGGKPYLWIRPLGSFSAQRLDRTEGA